MKNKNVIKQKLSKKQKQILITAVSLLMLIALTTCIYININKKDKVESTANTQDYIVTEYFTENRDEASKSYEIRYYPDKQKSFLMFMENADKHEKTLTEVKTKFRKECVNLSLNNGTKPEVKDFTQYADDSGFIYTCKIDEAQEFLSNEGVNGKIRFTYGTPAYFECYIENKAGEVMRGLFLYDSDKKTGTLIYKQCKADITIPAASDLVTAMEGDKQ